MANLKLYYVSQLDFDRQIKNAKLPLQQIQIYSMLARLGKPTRGSDVIEAAMKPKPDGEGLITRQKSEVLAAWYFSPKRRPDCVTLGIPTPVNEDPADKVTRLTAEKERIERELAEAEQAFLDAAEKEAEEESDEAGDEDKEESNEAAE